MYYRLDQVKLGLDESRELLPKRAARLLGIPENAIEDLIICRESLDARKKADIRRVYSLDVAVGKNVRPRGGFKAHAREGLRPVEPGSRPLRGRPLVIGLGPAGLFCALALAEAGYRPVVLERGQDVDTRTESVAAFWETGLLDPESNVQFGEGGAGTFSDGKLTCRSRDVVSHWVFEQLVAAGAPPEILYQAKPHVGTDLLKGVVKNIRERIISLGGQVRFGEKAQRWELDNSQIVAVETASGTRIETGAVALAIGHSARDTFEALNQAGIALSPKPFAVGFRIEHLQSVIDESQYGTFAGHPSLGAADYHLTHQTTGGRAAYTFCMCPGGHVVGAASEPEHLVVNGMSYHARDGVNANSALLVSVTERDYPEGPLGGIAFQRQLEQAAYCLGGGGYKAPVMTVGDFLGTTSVGTPGAVTPTHRPGHTPADLSRLLPETLTAALREGLTAFDRKLAGFGSPDALLTGVETRSSSPLRILRKSDTLESISAEGLYPCGEGAGYAGGIISSAVDGYRVAEAIIRKHQRPTHIAE